MARRLGLVALTQEKQGKSGESHFTWERAIVSSREALGGSSGLETAAILTSYADMLERSGLVREAERARREATAIVGGVPAFAGRDTGDAGGSGPAWKAGEKIDVVVDHRITVIQSFPDGSTQETRRSLRRLIRIAVTEVSAEGIATCRVKFRRMIMKHESPSATFDFDSDDPEKRDVDDPTVQHLKALAGTELTIQMDRRGELVSLTGTDAIAEKLLATVPHDERTTVAASIRAALREAERRQLNQLHAHVMPPDDAGIGTEWVEKQETNLDFGRVTMLTRFAVTEVDGDEVSVASSVRLLGGTASRRLPHRLAFTDLSGRGTARVRRGHPLLIDSDSVEEIRAVARGDALEVPMTIQVVSRRRSRRLVD